MTAFDDALSLVLRLESGYSDNPADPGGATNFGITQGTYDAYRASYGLPKLPVKEIDRQTVASLYFRNYWQDGKCDAISATHPHLAVAHFDAAVNCGITQAAKFVQRAVGVTDDGVIGPATLAALEGKDDDALTTNVLEQRAQFYKNLVAKRPSSQEFLAGWLARCRWVARTTNTPITDAFAKH